MKKIFSVLLTLAMVLSCVAFCFADESGDIVIVHTNDAHCSNYTAYDKVATVAKDADLLVDAGDAIQGDVIGTLSKGEYLVDIMNKLGYDVATLGNHEFDYSMDRLKELVAKADATYVSCNLVDLATGKSLFDAYKIIEVKGKKIAFVGITTPETFVKSTPTYFQDAAGNYIYGFCEGNNGQDLYAAVQKAADAAKAEGADYIIGLAHLGTDEESSPWTVKDVAAATTGFTAFIDGHSHSTYTETITDKAGKSVLLQQTGTKLENVGKITIKADGTVASENVALADVVAEAEVTSFIADVTAKFDGLQKQVVAKSDITLSVNDANGKRAVRNQETAIGDLCADAYRTLLGADVAFVNGGGIRADIKAGDLTFGDIVKVHPFGNMACLVEVTGQQILDALELGYSKVPNELGGFLQVSGITLKVDTSIASTVQLNDKSEFNGVAGARRVYDVKVGGQPIDPAKIYKLASHNYMLKSCGDGYAMFGKDKVTILRDEVLVDNQVLINYIVDKLGGTIGTQYSAPQGRITLVDKAAEEAAAAAAAQAAAEAAAQAAAAAAAAAAQTQPEITIAPAPAAETYTVVEGDCLWKIAEKCLNDKYAWEDLYELNKDILKSPHLIYVGQVLKLK